MDKLANTAAITASPRIGIFHLGLQHAWQTALACQQNADLAWFATTIFHDPNRWPYRIERYLPSSLRLKVGAEFRRRSSPLIDSSALRLFGFYEWAEVIYRRTFGGSDRRRFLESSRKYFFESVRRLIEQEPVDILWGFNGFSRDIFRWAKKRGIVCVLDQTIGHLGVYNEVITQEIESYPEFFIGMPSTYSKEFIEYQDEEAALADVVVVGSEFVRQTLLDRNLADSKIRLLPYGFEETEFGSPRRRIVDKNPVEFLFVGQVHPRKGVHYLLEAFREIDPKIAKLKMVGGLHIPTTLLTRYQNHVEFVSHVPRRAVPSIMNQSDCFIFPSLFEGSALVLYEAIGSGMGRIYSKQSGHSAPKGEGIELNEVSVAAIHEAINNACKNKDELQRWSEAANQQREAFSWSRYRVDVQKLISQIGV